MNQPTAHRDQVPSGVVSIIIFVLAIGGMALIKLSLFPTRYVALGYVLPLLVCLWHRDTRLLWAMAVTLAAMAGLKSFDLASEHRFAEGFEVVQWAMQLVNIFVVAGALHTILKLTARLRARNADLRAANEQLRAKEERITQQNAELQAQAEELVQQNEELQQQGEELGRQNEELQQQAEELDRQAGELHEQAQELQQVNQELSRREVMLQTVLGCAAGTQDERQMLDQVCRALLELLGEPAALAAVLERHGDQLRVQTQFGRAQLPAAGSSYDGSFAAVVMDHNRTAFVDDLAARPDLAVPQPDEQRFRSILATPLRRGGKPIGVVTVYSDHPQQWTKQHFRLIEWVAAQCSLALTCARLQEELATTNLALEQQVRERTASLHEMVNELEHFSYTITHDMRAPLRSMRGFAGTLKELLVGQTLPDIKDCLDRINRSAYRMDRLITDALSYSRTVKTELVLEPIDVAAVLHDIIDSYPQFQPPTAKIAIEGDLPIVRANEAGLAQCFSNLLDNAVKFIEPGGEAQVRIRAEIRQQYLRLWFIDNGIGVPEAFRARLFQMFQRASKSYEGTGIGLALVRKVAERMNGRVGFESAPSGGSRFWLELPLETDGVAELRPVSPSRQQGVGLRRPADGLVRTSAFTQGL